MRLDGFLFTFKRGTDVLLQLEGALQEFRITEYADACKKKGWCGQKMRRQVMRMGKMLERPKINKEQPD